MSLRLFILLLLSASVRGQPTFPQLASKAVGTVRPPTTYEWTAPAGAAGFRLHWGAQSGIYTFSMFVPDNGLPVHRATISNLNFYPFVVAAAVSAAGVEGPFSNEFPAAPATNRVVRVLAWCASSLNGARTNLVELYAATNAIGTNPIFFGCTVSNYLQ